MNKRNIGFFYFLGRFQTFLFAFFVAYYSEHCFVAIAKQEPKELEKASSLNKTNLLEIKNAIVYSPGRNISTNVTEILRARVIDDKVIMLAGRDFLCPRDIDPMHAKLTEITYVYNGKEYTTTFRDGQSIIIPRLEEHSKDPTPLGVKEENKRIKADVPALGKPDTIKAILQSVILIEAKDRAGTGFIVSNKNKKAILTNAHVLEGLTEPVFKTSSGEKLVVTKCEFAKTEDIARIEVETEIPALALGRDEPAMDEYVTIYGNSQGAGVLTKIPGRINGIGPNVIELQADFVAGNSGSPVVNSKGNVIGIATYATYSPPGSSWVEMGTRFSSVRRFAIRADKDFEWESVDLKKVIRQRGLLEDAIRLTCLTLDMANNDDNNIARFLAFSKRRSDYRKYFSIKEDEDPKSYNNKEYSELFQNIRNMDDDWRKKKGDPKEKKMYNTSALFKKRNNAVAAFVATPTAIFTTNKWSTYRQREDAKICLDALNSKSNAVEQLIKSLKAEDPIAAR